MKPLIAFIAGVFVGWWVKRAEPCQEQGEVNTRHHDDTLSVYYGFDADTVDKSLADTQPIRTRYTAEEIMPKRYPENNPKADSDYWVIDSDLVMSYGYDPKIEMWSWKNVDWFIDVPGAPEELKPLKYPENRPSEDGCYWVHISISDSWYQWIWNDNFRYIMRCGWGDPQEDPDWFIPHRISSQKEK